MILKAPPTAPCIVLKFVELAQTVLPPGVLQVLNGGNDLCVILSRSRGPSVIWMDADLGLAAS